MTMPSVTARVFGLLGAFDTTHRALRLSEISRRADLPLSTTHRLVAELVECGALRRAPTGEYVVGRRLWDLGLLAPVQTNLREAASPFLNDLYGATLETVHLAVRDQDQALYVERLAGHRSVPIVSTTGSRLPLHCTGVGKVLLAHAPDDVRERVLAGRKQRFTPYTVTSRRALEDQLSRILADGYATTIEEMTLGACSVAVPITAGPGSTDVVAAIGFVVPDLRRTKTRLVSALQVAAHGIARNLG